MFTILTNLAIGVITGLLANWLYDIFKLFDVGFKAHFGESFYINKKQA